ncbi:MAG TPA: hypothetical protein VK421_13235 [Pyrinomonadaceae bacterium]|nr:hypothetical protein [Pyrinomonadaceae bacterium]
MNETRRKFLRAGAVSALFAGLTLVPSKLLFGQKRRKAEGFGPAHDAKTDPVFFFNAEAFAAYLGSEFLFDAGSGRSRNVLARLDKVTDSQSEMRARRDATHEGQCFTLHFSAPAAKRAAQQGTYRVEHAALGRFSLFLVPGPARGGSVPYVAVINQLA